MDKHSKRNYVPDALEHLGKCIVETRRPQKNSAWIPGLRINPSGLQQAIRALPKKERQSIEKFFGLTGGPNHSKQVLKHSLKDTAYLNMRTTAINSLKMLFDLNYVVQYDQNLSKAVEELAQKIDKGLLEISDVDSVRYLLAFFVFILNGPKMVFEQDPMLMDNSLNENAPWNQIIMILELRHTFNQLANNSINLSLLVEFFNMMDLKDSIAIKKSVGLPFPKESFIDVTDLKNGIAVKKVIDTEDIMPLTTLSMVRRFKERIFPYGAWVVSNELILGNINEVIQLDSFVAELEVLCKDWSKISNYKAEQLSLKTSQGVRDLTVYDIGGLKFSDSYEIMFLYLESNLITKHA